MTTPTIKVKITANFERNLQDIERFLAELQTPQVFDVLLDELSDTVVPNLERFPQIGRVFLQRSVRSVEVNNSLAALSKKLKTHQLKLDLREYILPDYVILYALTVQSAKPAIYLLSIKHHRQLSFDFNAIWDAVP